MGSEMCIRDRDKILNEMDGSKKVSVLVNGLGSTPLMELYIMYRKTYEILNKNQIEIHSSFVGEFSTQTETSLTLSAVRLSLSQHLES